MFGVKLYKQSKDCPWIAELLLKLKNMDIQTPLTKKERKELKRQDKLEAKETTAQPVFQKLGQGYAVVWRKHEDDRQRKRKHRI